MQICTLTQTHDHASIPPLRPIYTGLSYDTIIRNKMFIVSDIAKNFDVMKMVSFDIILFIG